MNKYSVTINMCIKYNIGDLILVTKLTTHFISAL